MSIQRVKSTTIRWFQKLIYVKIFYRERNLHFKCNRNGAKTRYDFSNAIVCTDHENWIQRPAEDRSTTEDLNVQPGPKFFILENLTNLYEKKKNQITYCNTKLALYIFFFLTDDPTNSKIFQNVFNFAAFFHICYIIIVNSFTS